MNAAVRESRISSFACSRLDQAPEGVLEALCDLVRDCVKEREMEFFAFNELKVQHVSGEPVEAPDKNEKKRVVHIGSIQLHPGYPDDSATDIGFSADASGIYIDLEGDTLKIYDPDKKLDAFEIERLSKVVAHGIKETLDAKVMDVRMKAFIALRDVARYEHGLNGWNNPTHSKAGRGIDPGFLQRGKREAGVQGPELDEVKNDLAFKLEMFLSRVSVEWLARLLEAEIHVLTIDDGGLKIEMPPSDDDLTVKLSVSKKILAGPEWYSGGVKEALKKTFFEQVARLKSRREAALDANREEL